MPRSNLLTLGERSAIFRGSLRFIPVSVHVKRANDVVHEIWVVWICRDPDNGGSLHLVRRDLNSLQISYFCEAHHQNLRNVQKSLPYIASECNHV